MKRTTELITNGKELIQLIRQTKNVYAIVKLSSDDEKYIRVYKNDVIETVKSMISDNPEVAFEANQDGDNLYLGW